MYIRPVWKRGAYRVLVEKAEGTRRIWEDNIEMELREVGLEGGGMDWIDLAQDRYSWRVLVKVVMNRWVP
jgi:hypothetical protein